MQKTIQPHWVVAAYKTANTVTFKLFTSAKSWRLPLVLTNWIAALLQHFSMMATISASVSSIRLVNLALLHSRKQKTNRPKARSFLGAHRVSYLQWLLFQTHQTKAATWRIADSTLRMIKTTRGKSLATQALVMALNCAASLRLRSAVVFVKLASTQFS